VLVIGEGLFRLQQPGPKSWRFLVGARIFSEQPNQDRQPWPLHPIMASRLNVATLNEPYMLAEDKTPRWVTTDAQGYRRSNSATPYEVVMCGDSFFINDVIADSMAAALGQSVGNAAIDGRGTLTMVRFLAEPAPAYRHAKTVVWLRSETGITATGFLSQFNQYQNELTPISNPVRRLYAAWRETILWPNNLNGYLDETAPLRLPLRTLASNLNWHLLGQRDTTVILGSQALPSGVAPMQFLNDEQGLLPVPTSTAEIETIAEQVGRIQQRLAARGMTLVFAVAPDKSTIYRERLPANHKYRAGFIDQFNAALHHHHIPVVDLATGLRQEALRHPATPLFYTSDTHWNPKGQAIAARIMADSLQQWQSHKRE
jgi:hypothetical protein